MEQKPKTRHLTVFLIKKEYISWEQCLKKKPGYITHDLLPELNATGTILIGENKQRQPEWLSFLQEGSKARLEIGVNASTRALLFIIIKERLFAIAFGYGHYMLKDDCYERDFGLRVALNTIDPGKLRSLDTANFEELTVQTRKQTSKSSSMDAFGIDIHRDLMRMVTGEPSDQSLATRITGRDALIFNAKMSFSDLLEKLPRFLLAYSSDKYKENFPWIDNLSEVRDPIILEKLNSELLTSIKNKVFDKIHLSPPEPIDWSKTLGFKFSTEKNSADIYTDLEIMTYLDSIKSLDGLTAKKLKNHKILVKHSTDENLIPKWKVYDCIVFETFLNGNLYVLTIGKWFQVETDFAKTVTNFIRSISNAELNFPECGDSENENKYNMRVAKVLKNMVLMHGKEIKCETARDKIELCDFFNGQAQRAQFIHIKHKKGSSTLSHLFAQGRVSAESFLQDSQFRKKARKLISKKNKDLGKFFPDNKPNPGDYEIVFAFIDKSTRDLHESLPFFTKLNFMQTVRMLTLLGFNVSKLKINKKS